MLGKMLSYDMRALARPLILLHIAVMIVGFICCVAGVFGYSSYENENAFDRLAPDISSAIMGMAVVIIGFCMLLMFCAAVATFILVLVRFYRNLFTDEGYLTLTLPLTASQQLMSKVLAGIIWMLIDAVVILACMSLFAVTSGGFDPAYPTDTFPVWVLQAGSGGLSALASEATDIVSIAFLWIGTIVQMLFTLLLAYASFCLGSTAASKHKLAAGIGIFIGSWTVYSMLSGIFGVVFSLTSFVDFELTLRIVEMVNQFLEVGIIVACWFVSIWVLNRHVNLP